MKGYNRFTHNGENLEFCSPCYLCKHKEEMPVRNKNKCSAEECDYLKCYERLAQLEDKIEKATEIKVYYPGPYETKWAIVKYWARCGKPLAVASYYVCGEELKTGELLKCWHWLPSSNFNIIEDNFSTEAEATVRMKELRRLRNEANC